MLCHIVPATNGHFEILIRTEILIEIDMSDDILALYPPLALEIELITILPMLIYHTSIRAQSLISSIGNAADDALYLMEHFLIAQDECSFVEQPGSLDIVTVTLDVSLTFPLIIEEEVEMKGLLIEQLVGKDIQEIADALFKLFGLPHTIEIGIRLYDMQMGIHGTGTILILIRESHVCDWQPITGQRLDISIVLSIEGMLFDVVIEGDGDIQRFLVASSTRILGESVDGKADGIGLLLGIKRIALVIHAPVDASIFLIQEMITHILLGTGCSLQILWFLQYSVGCRKGPQDTGIHHCTFLGFRVYLVVAIHTSIEAAILFILYLVNPIVEDVVFQHILHCFFQIFHIFTFL